MIISAKLIVLRAAVIAWRADRARRRQLERELVTFVTPADRLELDAILARHTLEESREVWTILNQQAMSRHRAPHPFHR